MNTPAAKHEALAVDVALSDDTLRVMLADGSDLSVPLSWFPRLRGATSEQRRNWRLLRDGLSINWPAVDEHITVVGLLVTR